MSTSIDAKLSALDNILSTPANAPNVTLGLLNQAKNIADSNYKKGKIDTPFGNLFARDAVFLFDELNRMGVSDPSKLSAQVVGDKVVYKDDTTGNVIQESNVSEGGSLKLGKTGGRTGDVEGYDLFMVPNEQGGLTLASDKVEQSNWLKFRDNILKPAAVIGGAYLAATTLPGLLGGAGATTAGAVGTGTGALTGTTGLLGAESALAVAGVEGAASQLATTAYANAIAAGATPAIAAIAADTAAGLAGSGLTDAAILSSAAETASATAATGAATAAGEVVGGGGAITAGTTGSLLGNAAAGATTAATGATSGATGATTGATGATTATSGLSNLGNAASALLSGGGANLLGGLLSSGANLAMVQDAANNLRQQGQISQQEYQDLSNSLQGRYVGLGNYGQQGLEAVGRTAADMVGTFTPYGVTNQLFGTRVNPQTGALETTLTGMGEQLYTPFADVAAQSARAASMTDVDQLSKDYYAKVAALSAPEIERQRLATEERLRAQGRLGVSGSAFGGSSPELLAQEQAIARQQLERELQSRQAALGERGALINQGTAAYSPISNLLGMQGQQQQLSGQLGQTAQQGRIAAAQLYAQPAAQGYLTAMNLGAQGLQQVGQTERLGIASNLASQQAALDALAVGRSNVANNLLGQNGANVGNIVNAVTGLFNQPSNYVPGTDITYADALAQGLIAL